MKLRTATGVTQDLIRMTAIAAAAHTVVELRAAGDPPADAGTSDRGLGLLSGYPIVFNEWTEINSWWEGNFIERVDPSALDYTLARRGDRVKVLFNHGMDFSIGDKPLGKPQRQEPMDYGMWAETPLTDTSYNRDIAALIRDGALDGQSFRFSVIDEQWKAYAEGDQVPDYNPKGLDERTITRLDLFEHGPVTFPAYEATTLGLRSAGEAAAWRAGDAAVRSELVRAVAARWSIAVSDPRNVLQRMQDVASADASGSTEPPAADDNSDESRASTPPPGHDNGDQPPGLVQRGESGDPSHRSRQKARQQRVQQLLARTGLAIREAPDDGMRPMRTDPR